MNEAHLSTIWMDTSKLVRTNGIEERCNAPYIEQRLKGLFPYEEIAVTSVEINETGVFENPLGQMLPPQYAQAFTCRDLPAYCDVRIERKTPGNHTEHIIVWSPLAWNGRFMGTAGGGNQTGGMFHLTQPDNSNRGMSVPTAVCNGFTAATTDGGNVGSNPDGWGLDEETQQLDWELIKNWQGRSTHWMTLIGKAVAEILHQVAPQYSYMVGGSGGGRQAMMEAQQYPDDYDGIWASCPAIYWSKFVVTGLWPLVVMNEHRNHLSLAKLEAFRKAVHESCGGSESFYTKQERVNYNPLELVGYETADGVITETDAKVMQEIWDGPTDLNGKQLWYSHRPGTMFWNGDGLPLANLYYVKDEAGASVMKLFPLVEAYARWVFRDSKKDFSGIMKEEFLTLFERSIDDFREVATDHVDLRAYRDAGGKLLIDHGTEDCLIPGDGILQYYHQLIEVIGSKEETMHFCRLYFNPGDGHGNCYSFAPGISRTTGIKALMDWVERGVAPAKLPGMLVDAVTKELIRESELSVY